MKKRMALETYLVLIINIWIAIVVAGYQWDLSVIARLGGVSGQMPTIQAWIELIPVSETLALQLVDTYPTLNNTLSDVPLFFMRTLNASFLHFSWSHLFGNALSLWIIGKQYENVNYRGTFLIIYVFTGIVSMSSAALLQPNALTAGASGAVFGLMGASAMLSKRARRLAVKGDLTPHIHASYTRLGKLVYTLMIYNLIATFVMPGISIVAHISGLIAGFVIGLVIPVRDW